MLGISLYLLILHVSGKLYLHFTYVRREVYFVSVKETPQFLVYEFNITDYEKYGTCRKTMWHCLSSVPLSHIINRTKLMRRSELYESCISSSLKRSKLY
jgi:hypothetical protein